MKKAFYLLALLAVLTMSCTPQKPNPENQTVMKPEKNDDGEWDIDVIDTQYDYFLNAIAKPVSMYTESYLKTRNQFLVSEWNSYYYSGRYRNVIESAIDYEPYENYGLKFEYKLYQVFAYVHWKYGLRMQGLSATDRR